MWKLASISVSRVPTLVSSALKQADTVQTNYTKITGSSKHLLVAGVFLCRQLQVNYFLLDFNLVHKLLFKIIILNYVHTLSLYTRHWQLDNFTSAVSVECTKLAHHLYALNMDAQKDCLHLPYLVLHNPPGSCT